MNHPRSSRRPVAPPERIALVGYRGSGKTTVAQLVAGQLDWDWVDADDALEQRAGLRIVEIFARQGEAAFRDLESLVLADLLQRARLVVATGGGTVLRPENRRHLQSAWVVWLTAPATTLFERIRHDRSTASRRPGLTSAGGLAEVQQVLEERRSSYRAVADWQVSTEDKSPRQIADEIVAAWHANRSQRAGEP